MLCYETYQTDSTDPTYNPIWRQGSFVLPFTSRLGVTLSSTSPWSSDSVSPTHLLLSGLLLLGSIWHWVYWDLTLFLSSRFIAIDLFRVFSIHLSLSSVLCLGYGLFHVTGVYGPGIFTSDAFGILGTIRPIKPTYSISSLTTFSYGSIASHHLVAGLFGTSMSLWHLSSRPGPLLYSTLSMGNLESVLSKSIPPPLFK